MSKHKGKKIHYIFHGRFPSEKAHALFAAKTCEAFALEGFGVEMVVPDREHKNEDPSKFFKLKTPLQVTYLKAPDYSRWKNFRQIIFYWSHIIFGHKVRKYLKKTLQPGDIIYTNQSLELPWLPKGYTVCYELHDFPQRFFFLFRWLYSHAANILITNQWKSNEFKKHFPKLFDRTFVEQNAVEVEQFNIELSKKEARERLLLPKDQTIILYTGHLYGWKGVDTLAQAANDLPGGFEVYFVGGNPDAVVKFKEKYQGQRNIKIIGYRPHEEIPLWQKAADVLVIPNTAKEAISKYYTSPMKLFESLASRRPVVASDLPSIEEIVTSEEVNFFEPDDPEDLANVIMTAIEDEARSHAKVSSAYEKVKRYSWEARAKRIVEKF